MSSRRDRRAARAEQDRRGESRGDRQTVPVARPAAASDPLAPIPGLYPHPSGPTARLTVEQQVSTSPLPLPAIMEAYDRIVPGLAADIRDWTREEHEHRRAMERSDRRLAEDELKRNDTRMKLGMIGAFAVVVIFAAIAVIGTLHGEQWSAVAAILAAASPIVGHFLNQRNTPPPPEAR